MHKSSMRFEKIFKNLSNQEIRSNVESKPKYPPARVIGDDANSIENLWMYENHVNHKIPSFTASPSHLLIASTFNFNTAHKEAQGLPKV